MHQLCGQRYSDDPETCREETLYRFCKNIQEQVRLYNAPTCLYELEKIVKKGDFAAKSIDDGVQELRRYLETDTEGRKVQGYLNRKGPTADTSTSRSDSVRLEKRVHALEARVEAAPAPPSTTPQIHAVGGSGGSYKKDVEWVKREGVEGYPAPNAYKKPPLFVAKIYSKMGELPVAFPQSSKELVGPQCPGCKKARPNIPENGWYYKENHALFQSAGEGRVRPKVGQHDDGGPKYEPNTGFMHNAAFCQNVYADVHRWVKAHPEDKWMFDRVPDGEDAYAR